MTERPKRDIDICSKCRRFAVRGDAMFPMAFWCMFEFGEYRLANPRFFERDRYSSEPVPDNCPYLVEHKISDWSEP